MSDGPKDGRNVFCAQTVFEFIFGEKKKQKQKKKTGVRFSEPKIKKTQNKTKSIPTATMCNYTTAPKYVSTWFLMKDLCRSASLSQ